MTQAVVMRTGGLALDKDLVAALDEDIANICGDRRLRILLASWRRVRMRPINCRKLLHALGADLLASSDPVIMRDLQRGCITCAHKTQCDHDLAADVAVRNYRSYRPNAMSLGALVKAN